MAFFVFAATQMRKEPVTRSEDHECRTTATAATREADIHILAGRPPGRAGGRETGAWRTGEKRRGVRV
jgi:hypothetical protein